MSLDEQSASKSQNSDCPCKDRGHPTHSWDGIDSGRGLVRCFGEFCLPGIFVGAQAASDIGELLGTHDTLIGDAVKFSRQQKCHLHISNLRGEQELALERG